MQSQDPFCGWGLTVPDGTYAQMGVTFSGYRQYAHNDGTYYGPSWNPSSMYLEGDFLPSQTLTCAAALYVQPGVDVYTPDGVAYYEYHSAPQCDWHPEMVFTQRSSISYFVGLDVSNTYPHMAAGVSQGSYYWSFASGELNYPYLDANCGEQVG